jgi:hypothetical protein
LIFGPAPEAEDQVNETKENDDPKSRGDGQPSKKAGRMTTRSVGVNLARGQPEQVSAGRIGKAQTPVAQDGEGQAASEKTE